MCRELCPVPELDERLSRSEGKPRPCRVRKSVGSVEREAKGAGSRAYPELFAKFRSDGELCRELESLIFAFVKQL